MSLFEFFVVVIVFFFVAKPKDFSQIITQFKRFRFFITKTKQEILTYFDPIDDIKKSILDDSFKDETQLDQINFYLEKISNLGIEYEGEYSLSSVKDFYNKIIQEKIKNTSNST